MDGIREGLQLRNIPLVDLDDESLSSDGASEGDAWPLHLDMEYHGSTVKTIDLNNWGICLEALLIVALNR